MQSAKNGSKVAARRIVEATSPSGTRSGQAGGGNRRRQQEKVSTRKKVRTPQSAQQLLCLIIFYAVAASSFFLLHFIWQIVNAYIQNWEAQRRGPPYPKGSTPHWQLTEMSKVTKKKWKGILGRGSGKVSAHLCIQVSVRYIRIYGVIKRVSFYLSVGPKLFVTPNASLNDISWLLATVGWDGIGWERHLILEHIITTAVAYGFCLSYVQLKMPIFR